MNRLSMIVVVVPIALAATACSDSTTTEVVTVSQVTVAGLTTTTLPAGTTVQLSARVVGSNNAELSTVGRAVNWSSSNAAVATVSSSGMLTTVASGNATITVSVDGVAGSAAITVENPRPTITALTPTTVTAGQPFTLTVTGTGFIPTSSIRSQGTTVLPTTYVSATELRCTCQASGAGTVIVTVVNPSPGGGTSNSMNVMVTAAAPTLTSITPTSVAAATAFTLTVNGTNFTSGAQIRLNGAPVATTTFVSDTRLTTAVASTSFTSAASVQVTVVNPGVSTASNAMTLTVTAPANNCNNRPAYTLGAAISGSLSSDDCSIDNYFTDIFALTLTGAAAMTFNMTSTAFDSYLELRDASGNLLAGNDNASSSTQNATMRILAPPASYLIYASSAVTNVTGAYALNSTTTATPDISGCIEWWLVRPITLGDGINNTCLVTGTTQYLDPYTVYLRAGQAVTFTMTSTAFDAFLELRTSTGAIVASDDNGGGGTNARLTYTPTVTGAYVLRARSAQPGVTGSYVLSYQ